MVVGSVTEKGSVSGSVSYCREVCRFWAPSDRCGEVGRSGRFVGRELVSVRWFGPGCGLSIVVWLVTALLTLCALPVVSSRARIGSILPWCRSVVVRSFCLPVFGVPPGLPTLFASLC